MIPKTHRFHGINSLNRVYRKGKSARAGGLTIKTLPNRRKDYRLAVVISKKVHKSAVARNRVRRRLYEGVREARKADGKPWPRDIIISCYDAKMAEYPWPEAKKTLEKLLTRAGVYDKLIETNSSRTLEKDSRV